MVADAEDEEADEEEDEEEVDEHNADEGEDEVVEVDAADTARRRSICCRANAASSSACFLTLTAR